MIRTTVSNYRTSHRAPYTITLLIAFALILVCNFSQVNAASNVVPDGSTHTTMDAAQNDVPVVNIADPNLDGVSRNAYSDYNTDSGGLILNNSTGVGVSELGGALTGNPNFNGSAANVILNEVTSNQISILNGYTETFGQSAEFILANPNGITCNGCGFINNSRASLISGSENSATGQVGAFTLGPGSILIDSGGLNGNNIPYLDIISRTAQIQGELQAKIHLGIKTGNDQFDYQTGTVSSQAGVAGTPSVSIDASAIGSMYAGQIELVATEAGVGVNTAGLNASGDIRIIADGTVTQGGDYLATTAIDIEAQTLNLTLGIEAGGDIRLIQSQGNFNLGSAVKGGIGQTYIEALNGDLTLANSVYSAGDIDIRGQNITNQNKLAGRGNVSLSTAGSLINETGNLIYAGNNLLFKVDGSFDNSGDLLAASGTLTATNQTDAMMNAFYNRGGRVESQGNMTLKAALFENTYNPAVADPVIWGPTISISGTLQHTFEEINPALVRGLIQSNGDLAITADTVSNNFSDIFANGNLNIDAQQINNLAYVLQQKINQYVWVRKDCLFGRWNCKNIYEWQATTQDSTNKLFATIQAAQSLTLNTPPSGIIGNEEIRVGVFLPTANTAPAISDPLNGVSLPGQGGLFSPNPALDPSHPYLIVTDPALIDLGAFFGSDYFLDRTGYVASADPVFFIGDAYYEQQLIADQVRDLTGQRYLLNATDDNEQYKQLVDQAAIERERLDLVLGQELTEEQIDDLQDNIIWYVETEVDGKTVLVPKLYLAKVTRTRIAEGKAATMRGEEVVLNSGNVLNEGLIVSETSLTINVDEEVNNRGTLESGEDLIIVANNIINETIRWQKAAENNDALPGVGVNQQGSWLSEKSQWGSVFGGVNNSNIEQVVADKATLRAGRDLELAARGNIILTASDVVVGQDANLTASEDIVVNTVKLTNVTKTSGRGWTDTETTASHAVSDITVNGNLAMNAMGDILLEGAQVYIEGSGDITADQNIIIAAVENSRDRKYHHQKKKGLFKRKVTTTDISEAETQLVGTELKTGQGLTIESGTDTMVVASKLISGQDVDLSTRNGDILLLAGKDSQFSQTQRTKKGWIYTETSDQGNYNETLAGTLIQSDGDLRITTGKGTQAQQTIDETGNVVIVGATISSGGNIQFGAETLARVQQANTKEQRFILAKEDAARIQNLVFDTVALEEREWDYKTKKVNGIISGVVALITGGELEATKKVLDEGLIRKGSTVDAAKDVSAFTRNDIAVVGTDITAGGDINLNAGGDVNVLAALNSQMRREEDVLLQMSGFSVESTEGRVSVGLNGEYLKSVNIEERSMHQASMLDAGDDIFINSAGSVSIAGSELVSQDDLTIQALDALNILSVHDLLDFNDKRTEATARLSLGIRNSYVDLALAVKKEKNYKEEFEKASALKKVKLLRSARKKYKQIKKQVVNLAATTATAGFYFDLMLELKGSKTDTDTYQTTSVGSKLVAGKDIHLVSDNDLSIRASRLQANNNVYLTAANNINISSVEDYKAAQQSKKSANFSVSVGLSGPMEGNTDWKIGASKGSSDSEAITQSKADISAGNDIFADSGNDISVLGSDLNAVNNISLAALNDVSILATKNESRHQSDNTSIQFAWSTSDKETETINAKNEDITTTDINNDAKSFGFKNGESYGGAINWTESKLLAGGELSVSSGNDLSIKGSDVEAVGDIALVASNNIDISSVQNSTSSYADSMDFKLGWAKQRKTTEIQHDTDADFESTDSESVTRKRSVGYTDQSSNIYSTTTRGSRLASTSNISINSGADIQLTGSDISAAKDVNMSAVKNVNIAAVLDSSTNSAGNNGFGYTHSRSKSHKTETDDNDVGMDDVYERPGKKTRANEAKLLYGQTDTTTNTWRNSTITSGATLNLKSGNDMMIAGAEVFGDNLVVAVGGDLGVQSLQNSVSKAGANVGLSTSVKKSAVNVGTSSQDRLWVDNTTKLIGNSSVDITVNKNTSLIGAVIANIDKDGNDAGNLMIATNSLIYKDLKDHDSTLDQNIGLSTNYPNRFMGDYSPSKKQKEREKKYGNVIPGKSKIKLKQGGRNKEQTTYATIGKGSILQSGSNVTDLSNLGRDVSKSQVITKDEEVGGIDFGVGIEHLWLTKNGWRAFIGEQKDKWKKMKRKIKKQKEKIFGH